MIEYKDLATEYIDAGIEKYIDPLNRASDFTWDKFPMMVAGDLIAVLDKYYDKYDESFKDVVFKYTLEEATRRIKRGDHLPTTTFRWIRKHFGINGKLSKYLGSSPVTIRQWLYSTIEGQSSYHIAKHAKEGNMLEDNFVMFTGCCNDPEIQWCLMSRIGYSFDSNPFGINYENEVVNEFYHMKPVGYTFDKDQNHHLGWFIENVKRENLDRLSMEICNKLFIDLMLRA